MNPTPDVRRFLVAVALACAGSMTTAPAIAEEDPTTQAAAAIAEQYNLDVKKLFATNCSWCHSAYGMKAADGPKLAGTGKNRDQLIAQISVGRSPMPGFRKTLKQEQIQALADYIKALPAN